MLNQIRHKQEGNNQNVKMHFSLVFKRLECVDLKEKNLKQMYDQINRRYNSRRKNSLHFYKILKHYYINKHLNLVLIIKFKNNKNYYHLLI